MAKAGTKKQMTHPRVKGPQMALFGRDKIQERPFGGSLLKNSHAKTKRPFAPRAKMHLTLKTRGYGRLLSWGRRKKVELIVRAIARTNRIEIIKFANGGNHLHLLLSCREKDRLSGFLRGISGAIARMVTADEARRGFARSVTERSERAQLPTTLAERPTLKTGFWLQRPWSRVVASAGRDYDVVAKYVDLNQIESWGHSRKQARLMWDQWKSELSDCRTFRLGCRETAQRLI